jgi:ATP-dependent helicase YprA (DUF1998 family)
MYSESPKNPLELMRLGTNYRFELTLRAFKTMARPLSIAEQTEVASRVLAYMNELPPERRNRIEEDTAKAKVSLELATTFQGAQVAGLTQMLLSQLTPAELMHLWQQYVAGTDRVNPSLEQMSAEDLNSMVEALKKSSDAERRELLTTLSFWQLIDLCQSLIKVG